MAKRLEAGERDRIIARRDVLPAAFRSSAFCLLPSAFLPRRRGEDGSAIIFVMLTVCVLSVVAASLLLTNVSRYQTTFQSASWQEAIVGSEAGIDLAMNELRQRVITGPAVSFQTNWTTTSPQTGAAYANYGHAFPASNQPYPIAAHTGEGNTAMQVRVFVDVPGSGTRHEFRAVQRYFLHLPGRQSQPARSRRGGPLTLALPHQEPGHHRALGSPAAQPQQI